METKTINQMAEDLPESQLKTAKALVSQFTGNDLEWTWGARERAVETQVVLIFTRLNNKMKDAVKEFNESINAVARG